MAGNDEQVINIPLPRRVHDGLKDLRERTGMAMKDLAAKAVEAAVTGETMSITADPELGDVRLDMAEAALAGDVGARIGVANHYRNLGKSHLAYLLYAFAAETMAQSDDPDGVSQAVRRLLTTAGYAHQDHQPQMQIALLRQVLALQPNNLIARNHLGQAHYFQGDYEAAIEHLDPVRERDNRAQLFYGFASMKVGLQSDSVAVVRRGRELVVAAMESWALGNRDTRDRLAWLRQLGEFSRLGDDVRQSVDELIDYANMNSGWDALVSRDELSKVPRASETGAPDEAASSSIV